VPIRALVNFGHISAPRLPQRVQVKFGLISAGRTFVSPAVGAGVDVAAPVIAAIDQHVADAGGAQFAEGYFLCVGVMVV
jgi:hypothetical protein